MKRSEMVNLIAEALLNNTNYWGAAPDEREEVREVSRMARIKFAHEALKCAEENGMLPTVDKGKSWKILENGQMSYLVHGWEPE